ncbi:uncharacterized protein [Penaeus vannamei]|uniref:uncharacterized protein n=1 Tax=Penaeus vannamei TaxID=6689 RepID=UPI00387F5C9A
MGGPGMLKNVLDQYRNASRLINKKVCQVMSLLLYCHNHVIIHTMFLHLLFPQMLWQLRHRSIAIAALISFNIKLSSFLTFFSRLQRRKGRQNSERRRNETQPNRQDHPPRPRERAQLPPKKRVPLHPLSSGNLLSGGIK